MGSCRFLIIRNLNFTHGFIVFSVPLRADCIIRSYCVDASIPSQTLFTHHLLTNSSELLNYDRMLLYRS